MRRKIIDELLTLTNEQRLALKQADITIFECLMQKKQVVIECLISKDKGVHTLFTDEERKLLEKVIILEEENKREFNRQYIEAKEKVKNIRRSRNSHQIYANPYDVWQEEGIFFDKK